MDGTKETVSPLSFCGAFPPFSGAKGPTLVLETKGKRLKLVQTILGMKLIPFHSEAATKDEMTDQGP